MQGREAGQHGANLASSYIVSCLKVIGIPSLGEDYYQPFEAYRKERQRKGRLEVNPDSIAIIKKGVHQRYDMRNVLGMIPGKNSDEYVIVGAHFDHLGMDPMLHGIIFIMVQTIMLQEFRLCCRLQRHLWKQENNRSVM